MTTDKPCLGWYIEPCKKCRTLKIMDIGDGAAFSCECPLPSVPDAVTRPAEEIQREAYEAGFYEGMMPTQTFEDSFATFLEQKEAE